MGNMADRKEETVKWFNEKKRYGFISYKGEDDLFVHFSDIETDGLAATSIHWIVAIDENDKVYKLLAKIYDFLGNKELSKKLLDLNLRTTTVNSLKNELSGIYRKES